MAFSDTTLAREEGHCFVTARWVVGVQVPHLASVDNHGRGVCFLLVLGGCGNSGTPLGLYSYLISCSPHGLQWHHGRGNEWLHYCWAVVKLLTLCQASWHYPSKEEETCFVIARLPLWSLLIPFGGFLSLSPTRNESPATLLSLLWYHPGESIVKLCYSLARG